MEIYQLGRWAPGMPVPPVPEDCVSVDAGPVRFVVEARQFDPGVDGVDEYFGATLHVEGSDDGLEHLRFDCFDEDPHYHYIYQADQENLVCRFDEIAQGPPIPWTLGRLRERLPEMLDFAGVSTLAASVREHWPTVLAGVDQVAALMEEASRRAQAARSAARGGS